MNGQTLFGGICGLIMGPGFITMMILFPEELEEFGILGRIFLGLMFLGFTFLGPWLIYNYLCHAAIDDDGLYGYRPFRGFTFIPWSEVHRVTSDEPHKRLIVSDEAGQRVIWVEYQFVEFGLASELIHQAVDESAYAVDHVEKTFRVGGLIIPLYVGGFLGSLGVVHTCYPSRMDGVIVAIICAGMLAYQIFSIVLRLDLNPDGILLSRLLRKRFIPYSKIVHVESSVDHDPNGERTVLVKIVLTDLKTVTLKHLSGSAEVLKRSLEIALEAHRRLHPPKNK